MGKLDYEKNIPAHISLSYTLTSLLTCVQIEPSTKDHWQPVDKPGFQPLKLSSAGQKRFFNHFEFLKEIFHIKGFFKISSANNFPSDCGLASSASSFAALTSCAAQMSSSPADTLQLARLSQRGSGSSCRSFFTPWAVWEGNTMRALNLPLLDHEVVLMETAQKKVSSSEAHRRALTSPFFEKRKHRATERTEALVKALNEDRWRKAYEICWEEFQDMHRLFETSERPFSYKTPQVDQFLEKVQAQWELQGEGPLVTMDAGSNIHFLWKKDFPTEKRKLFLQSCF